MTGSDSGSTGEEADLAHMDGKCGHPESGSAEIPCVESQNERGH